jgi:hypothetical protein
VTVDGVLLILVVVISIDVFVVALGIEQEPASAEILYDKFRIA